MSKIPCYDNYINDLRSQMDSLDDEIIALISRRHSIAKVLGSYKISHNMLIIDEKREAEVKIYHKKLSIKYDIPYSYISELYGLIIKQSREIQLKLS